MRCVEYYFHNNLKAIRMVLARFVFITGLVGLAFVLSAGSASSQPARRGNFQRIDYLPPQTEDADNVFRGEYYLSFSENIEVKSGQESAIPIFYMDILGASIDANPFLLNFPRGPVKLVRLNQTSVEPSVVRATFFLRNHLSQQIKVEDRKVIVSFAPAEKGSQNKEPDRRAFSLIPPEAPLKVKKASKRYEPINIIVNNSDPESIFRELARRSGKAVHFRDPIKNPGQISISAADPIEAMNEIADKIGAVVTEEDGDIWVSTTENPLLRLSSSDTVGQADLSNLALGDVLRALGQIAELNVILDKSMDPIKDRPVEMYLQKISIRRAFETLLKLNELVFNPVDDKTMLIMTLAAARNLEGRVVRIVPVQVPLAKLNNMAKQSLSAELLARVSIQEDLGNLVIIGDREAVDNAQTILASIENKLLQIGDSISREFFHPVNTNPKELIKMVSEALENTENFKITHDERTDMLVFSGSKTSTEKAVSLARKLDKTPTRQALIHIRLIEINRSELEVMGIKIPDKIAAATDIGKFDPSTIVIPGELTAFIDNTKIKTLANPTLRCMDKQLSTIDISEQIPVKSTVTDYLPVASASLAARTSDVWTTSEIGIKLSVTPQIHQDKEVTMDVTVDQTELVSLVEGHPWTAKRMIKTKARVKDSETVVIGGLIRSKKDNKRRPVPILSKIPILKKLFRHIEHREDREEKTEMVILITPRIVDSKGESIKGDETVDSSLDKARRINVANRSDK